MTVTQITQHLKSELDRPGCGLNHPLHYVESVPTKVLYQGEPVDLLGIDFYEAAIPGKGWVPLDEAVQLPQ